MKIVALCLALGTGLPLAASAQTTAASTVAPCISCIIAAQNAAIQSAINRMTVQNQLNADLQSRLQIQQSTLDAQRTLNAFQMRSALDANDAAIRQILLQQQLNLLKLQVQTAKKKRGPTPR